MLTEYIQHMLGAGREAINRATTEPGQNVRSSVLNWPDGPALQFGLSTWPSKTNVTLLLLNDGRFRIQFYVSELPEGTHDKLWHDVEPSKYPRHWLEQQTLNCFGFFETAQHDIALQEVAAVAAKVDSIYTTGIQDRHASK